MYNNSMASVTGVGAKKAPASASRILEKRINQFQRAYCAALCSAFGINVDRHPSARAFIRKRSKMFALEGDKFLKTFKKDCAAVRWVVYEGTFDRSVLARVLPRCFSSCKKRVKLLQFIKIGRALPCLTDKKAAMDAYYESISKPRYCGKAEALLLYKKLRPYRKPIPPATLVDYCGTSSCKGFGRDVGGRSQFLRTKGVSFPNPARYNKYSSLNRVILRDFPSENCNSYKNEPLEAESVALPEVGAKFRIITKNDPTQVAESHRVRKTYFPLLLSNKNTVVSEALRDPDLVELDLRPKGKKSDFRKRQYYSADLSSATDYLSREAIVSVAEALGFDPDLAYAQRVDGRPCLSGTLMGLPASWTILSLVHYVLASSIDPDHCFRLKGDDLIAFWTKRQWEAYKFRMENVGFVINVTKSFIAKTFGNFCEVDYAEKRIRGVLHREPTYSVKSLATNLPLSPEQWRLLLRLGAPLWKLSALQRKFCSKWYQAARRVGIDACAPPKLGGLGLCPSRLDRSVSKGTSILCRAAHDGVQICQDMPEDKGPLVSVYTHYLETAIFRAHPDAVEVDLKECYETIGRAAVIDGTRGLLRKSKVNSPFNVAKHKLRYIKEVLPALSIAPLPMTLQHTYEIVDRLVCVDRGVAGNVKGLARGLRNRTETGC
uniref:RNA-dependent RNA polymerase n=1 Tax=Erysiphales narna-like virus 3 TaxID=2719866 RepID=A0A6G9EMA7_9VIRU|nr:RNA-dependent RNA polymerase [Erysiphales narna-like virus 3]